MADEELKDQDNSQDTNEKKEKKKKEKKEKKDSKKKGADNDNDDEEGIGSKIMLGIVTVIIIAIWLGIFGILIKFDVGGFGSTVLYPLLKDVPVVNKVLPDVKIVDSTEAERYPYDSLDEAIDAIKSLEQQLQQAQAENEDLKNQLSDKDGQLSDLSTYRQEEAEFESLKEKFYEEVVFSDKAPDIKEYKTYYESIDPENAEVLYKQVVEQIEEDAEIEEYAKRYSSMKPANAAAIFDSMTDDFELVAKILKNMSVQSASDILAAMKADNAAKLTEIMEP